MNMLMNQGLDFHKKGQYQEAEKIYLTALNSAPNEPQILYVYGDLLARTGRNGLAVNLLTNSIALKPAQEPYIVLGCALKAEFFIDEARAAWEKALEFGGNAEAFNNLAALDSDSGGVEKALFYADKSLAIEPDNPHAHWNKALALLTDRQWEQGWVEYEARLKPGYVSGPSPRDYGVPFWDGRDNQKLIVHGEQGIGDEIMFLSCLGDLLAQGHEVVVEVEPRLIPIVERSFPGVRAYGNAEALIEHELKTGRFKATAKVALGSLPKFFRPDDGSFPQRTKGYLMPNPELVEKWKKIFATLGPRPWIGVAWQGGTKQTRVFQRTINAETLTFAKASGTVISMQYGPAGEHGAKIGGYHFFAESDGRNMDEQMAMAAACDMVLTVCQTLVHVCGSIGKRCYVLTPKGSSWRYGRVSTMRWYPTVGLLRQEVEGDWSGPLERARNLLLHHSDEYLREDIA